MNFWWLSQSARLAAEKRAVEALAGDGWFTLTRWGLFNLRVGAEGVITAHGHSYPVRLVYPDLFPLVPAWVEPQDETVRWSQHQYGEGGVLCLELRPDTWHPSATGADVLASAHNLLVQEDPLGGTGSPAPSGHHVGDIQSYTWKAEPVLIGEGCLARIIAGDAQGVSSLRWVADDNIWPMMAFDAVDRARPEHPPSFDLGTFRVEIAARVGTRLPENTPKTRAELIEAAQVDLTGVAEDAGVLVIAVEDGKAVPYHSPNAGQVFSRTWVVLPEDGGVRSGRTEGVAGKSVAVIGAGSLGSKLAESLVRSGVRRLVIVDGDVFLPANLERHTLDWRDVGFLKAGALERRLKHIVPGLEVVVLPYNIDWQRSAKTQAAALDVIGSADVIVDATGSVPSSMFLGAVAAQSGKAFVSAAVFEGGLGALVVRSLPGRDPTYTDGRAAFVAYCEGLKVEPPSSGNRSYEAIAEDGMPIVADDAAVTMAAGHSARVVLDILDGRVEAHDNPWMLFGFRKGWLFRFHGDVISLDIAPLAPVAAERDKEGEELAAQLIKDIVDETPAAA